ncbi:malto-oligosyltrehalose trehalohydrolase, partial [Pseudomonas sp. SIMBA_077]
MLLLLSPMIPLPFLGDDVAAQEPFLFFTSHQGQLAEAVRRLHPQLPIILASGYAQRQDGPVPELPRIFKPFSQAQLRDA